MFKNNFDLFQLFITKRIHVWDENIHFDVIVPTIRELYQDEAVNLIRNFLTCSKDQLAQFNPFQDEDEIDSYHVILICGIPGICRAIPRGSAKNFAWHRI